MFGNLLGSGRIWKFIQHAVSREIWCETEITAKFWSGDEWHSLLLSIHPLFQLQLGNNFITNKKSFNVFTKRSQNCKEKSTNSELRAQTKQWKEAEKINVFSQNLYILKNEFLTLSQFLTIMFSCAVHNNVLQALKNSMPYNFCRVEIYFLVF